MDLLHPLEVKHPVRENMTSEFDLCNLLQLSLVLRLSSYGRAESSCTIYFSIWCAVVASHIWWKNLAARAKYIQHIGNCHYLQITAICFLMVVHIFHVPLAFLFGAYSYVLHKYCE